MLGCEASSFAAQMFSVWVPDSEDTILGTHSEDMYLGSERLESQSEGINFMIIVVQL
jgi:hypothetical protein